MKNKEKELGMGSGWAALAAVALLAGASPGWALNAPTLGSASSFVMLGGAGVTCTDCHRQVTTNGTSIANPLLHVDKSKQVAFTVAGFAYDPATRRCTGTCHGDNHNDTW